MAKYSDLSLSVSVGDYLKAVWALANTSPASTTALAERLGVSAASVSSMLGKLREMGLVDYERYRGVHLTERGRREVMRLLRRHRLLETFMLEHLGYSWDEVHEDAEAIEHALSDRFTERLAVLLEHPTHDPHGDPIPNSSGALPDTPSTPLAEVAVGDVLRVSRLLTQDDDVLRHLADLSIRPGQTLEVIRREPLGGLISVKIDDANQVPSQEEVLSKELAMLVRGEVVA